MNRNNLIFAVVLIVIAFVARVVPHVSNFSPIIALSLFSGAVFCKNKWFYILPVGAMVLSDFYLGFHALSPLIYSILALVAVFGMKLNKNLESSSLQNNMSLLSKTTLAAVFFFLTSNLAVFFMTKMYPMSWAGLVECYTLALPFFRNTLVSTLGYSFVLFNLYAFARQKIVQLA